MQNFRKGKFSLCTLPIFIGPEHWAIFQLICNCLYLYIFAWAFSKALEGWSFLTKEGKNAEKAHSDNDYCIWLSQLLQKTHLVRLLQKDIIQSFLKKLIFKNSGPSGLLTSFISYLYFSSTSSLPCQILFYFKNKTLTHESLSSICFWWDPNGSNFDLLTKITTLTLVKSGMKARTQIVGCFSGSRERW